MHYAEVQVCEEPNLQGKHANGLSLTCQETGCLAVAWRLVPASDTHGRAEPGQCLVAG
jgi:hypothetical protein